MRTNSQLDSRYAAMSHTHTVAQVTGAAAAGTGGSQVRTNSQLDARYLQSVSGGSGVNVSGNTISVDNTVLRTTGNQTVGGTNTFSSPVVVANATASNHAATLGQVNNATANGKPARLSNTLRGNSISSLDGWSDTRPVGQGWWGIVPANTFLNSKDTYVIKGSTKVSSATAIGYRLGGSSASRSTITALNPAVSVYVDVELVLDYENGNLYYTLNVSTKNGAIPGDIINGMISSFNTASEVYFSIDGLFQGGIGAYTTGAVTSVFYPAQVE